MQDSEQASDWRAEVGERCDPGLSKDLARAREDGRGREADTPNQIPGRGWIDILVRVFWSVSADRILSTAGGVAFFALLAVFPAIAAIVSLYGLFADPSTIGTHLSMLAGIFPSGVIALIGDQVTSVVRNSNNTLGWAFVVSLALALYSANSGITALFDALNVVYDEKEKRHPVRLYLITFLFTLAGILFVTVAIVGIVVLPVILESLGLSRTSELIFSILRWPILLVTIATSLAVIYRYGPSRSDARWRWVTWGSVAAALLWIAASMVFSWYVATFDSYNRVYGSLGAGVGFMVWLWISAIVVLIGGELNAEMEHQTARDTTEGRPQPLGLRGANMADHVGEAQA